MPSMPLIFLRLGSSAKGGDQWTVIAEGYVTEVLSGIGQLCVYQGPVDAQWHALLQ